MTIGPTLSVAQVSGGRSLHVVHEPEDEARELNVQESDAVLDDLRSRQGCDDGSREAGQCVPCRAGVGKGRYSVPLVRCLAGYAVRARWAREELSVPGAEAIGPYARTADQQVRGQQ